MAIDANVMPRRHGGVLMIVLLIMIAVAFLASQGVRLMMLSNRAYDQRNTSAQIKELVELAKLRLADQNQEESLTVEVPNVSGRPARTASIVIENKVNASGWRIMVRFPHNQPNEMTVTWESPS